MAKANPRLNRSGDYVVSNQAEWLHQIHNQKREAEARSSEAGGGNQQTVSWRLPQMEMADEQLKEDCGDAGRRSADATAVAGDRQGASVRARRDAGWPALGERLESGRPP